jgi:hypothetical protein
MEPYMSNESAEIRDWSAKVLTVLFQRQPEKTFIDPVLNRAILQRMKDFVRENNEPEAERLI